MCPKADTEEALGVWAGLWIIAVHSYHFSWQNCKRKQASPTVQDLLKLNKVIRAAKVTESKIKIRSIEWNIFASWVFMMRLMQILKEVRHSRVISFLQYMQASRIVAFLCLCWAGRARRSRGLSAAVWLQRPWSSRPCQEHLDWMRTMWGTDDPWWFCAWELRIVSHGASQYSCHRLQKLVRRNTQRMSSSSVNRQEIGNWAGHSQG